MFTGITRGTFEVTNVEALPDLLRYEVTLSPDLARDLEVGASVSVDGVCQTVVQIMDGCRVAFEAIRETLDRTTLGDLSRGQHVAIERSARIGDEVGGHDVAGHAVGTGEVLTVNRGDNICDLHVAVPPDWIKYILPKGFIALEGSSLTIGKVEPEGRFWVHLIPETLKLTKLGTKVEGDRVNIELDSRTVAIVETVERVLEQRSAISGGTSA